jgi:hypothetical protein
VRIALIEVLSGARCCDCLHVLRRDKHNRVRIGVGDEVFRPIVEMEAMFEDEVGV